MANVFINLPTPAANGAGAAVDVSALAAAKTFVSAGNGAAIEPFITIEVSNDVAGTNFAPIHGFAGQPGDVTLSIVCRWARAVVANYHGGGAPQVDVGADTDPAAFATLVATAGNGSGASVNTSALADFKTVQVAGVFSGSVNIEISEAGVTDWSTAMSFQAPGVQSAYFTAQHMRVTRVSLPLASGLPVIDVAANSGGSGSGGGIDVEDEGVPIAGNPHDTMNFVGAGVTVADVGGVATVTIPGGAGGLAVQEEGVAIPNNPHATMNFVGAGVTATDVAGVATITVPGGIAGLAIQNETVPIAGSPFSTLNLVGGGVVATNGGGGIADIAIPGIIVLDEGIAVAGAPHFTHDFIGGGVAVTNGGGGIAQITINGSVYSPPEQWAQNNVVASQTNVVLDTQVSTNFDTWAAIRAGSLTGLRVRLTEPITAGTLTVEVIVNSAGTGFQLVCDAGTFPSGGSATQSAGVDVFVAGDLIGIRITTTAGFLPITIDLEAYLDMIVGVT